LGTNDRLNRVLGANQSYERSRNGNTNNHEMLHEGGNNRTGKKAGHSCITFKGTRRATARLQVKDKTNGWTERTGTVIEPLVG